jgi:enoyl-CoA hydratase
MPAENTVIKESRGRILVITLDRADKRNAIDASITAGLDAALNELEDDPELACGVLTGGPHVFSAGADLASGPGDPTARGGIAGIITRSRPKPLVAAVEGLALGGGMELVLCCDLVVASTTAAFGLPEARRGLMPDFGGAFRLAHLLPANLARELLLTTDNLTAERAERLGFVNRLVDPGHALEVAIELAERICENAPLAIRESLALVNATIMGDESESWRKSHDAHARLLVTSDVKEGIDAFFQRRPPTWTGR